LKDLWIELDPATPGNDKLEKVARKVCDVLIEGKKATNCLDNSEIKVIESFDEDLITRLKREGKKVALRISINGKEDENIAVKAAELSTDFIVLNCQDWRVIPLENLIARTRGKSKLIAEVASAEQARLVLEALELGTDGVLLKATDPEEIMKTAAAVKKQVPRIEMVLAKIVAVKPIGTGARVCVDTCDLMTAGEGLLIGCQSSGLFLVEAEVHENPYVASRPFRVNAGSISMYTLGSTQNTRYLSELRAGDEVLIIDRQGNLRQANVGRIKIEFRPLILVEADVDGKTIKTILQNAETIRLVTKETSKPVTHLKAGDEVLVHMAAKGGRHFGISVPEEKVIEH
jgi:3-dehydroquinate synthase II